MIDTEKKLTEEEIVEAMVNMKYRLEEYHTECPEFLIGSDIHIDKYYFETTLP